MEIITVFLMLAFLVAVPFIIGILAARKGYAFWAWFFSGVIGLVVLAFQPDTQKADMTHIERVNTIDRGNQIGRVISGITLAVLFLNFLSRQ